MRSKNTLLRLTVLLSLLLVPAALLADYRDDFKKGVSAFEEKKWGEAAAFFRSAVSENPTESNEKVRISGTFREEYLPHYWLGMALYNLGDPDGARDALAKSVEQGFLQRNRRQWRDAEPVVAELGAGAGGGDDIAEPLGRARTQIAAASSARRQLDTLLGNRAMLDVATASGLADEWRRLSSRVDALSGELTRLEQAGDAAGLNDLAQRAASLQTESGSLESRVEQAAGQRFDEDFRSAESALSGGDHARARELVAAMLALRPGDARAVALGDRIASAEAAPAEVPASDRVADLVAQAEEVLVAGDAAGASRLLDQAAELAPRDGRIGALRRRVEAAQLRPAQQAGGARRSLRDLPQDLQDMVDRGDLRGAEAALRSAEAEHGTDDPTVAGSRRQLETARRLIDLEDQAGTALAAGDLDTARRRIDEVLEEEPARASAVELRDRIVETASAADDSRAETSQVAAAPRERPSAPADATSTDPAPAAADEVAEAVDGGGAASPVAPEEAGGGVSMLLVVLVVALLAVGGFFGYRFVSKGKASGAVAAVGAEKVAAKAAPAPAPAPPQPQAKSKPAKAKSAQAPGKGKQRQKQKRQKQQKPKPQQKQQKPAPPPPSLAELTIDALPWARVDSIESASGAKDVLAKPDFTPLALQLPEGRYKVSMSRNGSSKVRDVEVSATGSNHVVEVFEELSPGAYLADAGLGSASDPRSS
jgi:tetratricopeptide (TPR) repeat protein